MNDNYSNSILLNDSTSPDKCRTMAEVRCGVDETDRAIIALLARRFGYMDAAARIKPDRASVRDEARKAEVIANARSEAVRLGVPEPLIAQFWENLVETSIAHEFDQWDQLRQDKG